LSKKTPLFARHIAAGARMVEFAGWQMPVSYTGINQEVTAVRQGAGLFDVSHMGQLDLTGPQSTETLQQLLTNDVAGVETGRGVYSPMCNENGGTVDDLIAFRISDDRWCLVVNASRVAVDVEWMSDHLVGETELLIRGSDAALLALQGPASESILSPCVDTPLAALGKNGCSTAFCCGCPALISRTGYTGEDGFEVFVRASDAGRVWDSLTLSPQVAPCGLGARDVLRLEAGLCLYGHELTEDISPLEAGLDWTVKFSNGEFIGRDALMKVQQSGASRRLTGIRMTDRAIAREGYAVLFNGRPIGSVTSGTYSVTLGSGIALALLEPEFASPGRHVHVSIRNDLKEAVTVAAPFVGCVARPECLSTISNKEDNGT